VSSAAMNAPREASTMVHTWCGACLVCVGMSTPCP
jgi:hypothetical protein